MLTPETFVAVAKCQDTLLTTYDRVSDMNEVAKCRRDHNCLGFAYQIGFAQLFNRFPAQQPSEINDELLSFVAVHEWENVIL